MFGLRKGQKSTFTLSLLRCRYVDFADSRALLMTMELEIKGMWRKGPDVNELRRLERQSQTTEAAK